MGRAREHRWSQEHLSHYVEGDLGPLLVAAWTAMRGTVWTAGAASGRCAP